MFQRLIERYDTSAAWNRIRVRAADIGVSTVILAWILACGSKQKEAPKKPTTVAASPAQVTHKQLEEGPLSTSSSATSSSDGAIAAASAPTSGVEGPAADQIRAAAELLHAGQFGKAASRAQDALRTDIPDPQLKAQAVTIALTGSTLQGQPEQGLAFAPEAEEVLASSADASTKVALLRSLALARTVAGEPARAVEAADRLIALAEGDQGPGSEAVVSARNFRAASVLRTGDARNARKEFEALVDLSGGKLGDEHPETVKAHLGLGAALNQAKQYRAAKDQLEQARNLLIRSGENMQGVQARIYQLLGDAYAGLEKRDRARDAYETALALMEKAQAKATLRDPMLDKHIEELKAHLEASD